MQPEFAGFVGLWALACAPMIIRRGHSRGGVLNEGPT
jgi:hypothetical protein